MTPVSTSTSLLQNKHAVIFGAGGAVGAAVAKEFAAQGATVFLSGRRFAAVEPVAASIQQDGGIALAAEVDALDERAVQAYLDRVAQEAGSIDMLLKEASSSLSPPFPRRAGKTPSPLAPLLGPWNRSCAVLPPIWDRLESESLAFVPGRCWRREPSSKRFTTLPTP